MKNIDLVEPKDILVGPYRRLGTHFINDVMYDNKMREIHLISGRYAEVILVYMFTEHSRKKLNYYVRLGHTVDRVQKAIEELVERSIYDNTSDMEKVSGVNGSEYNL